MLTPAAKGGAVIAEMAAASLGGLAWLLWGFLHTLPDIEEILLADMNCSQKVMKSTASPISLI